MAVAAMDAPATTRSESRGSPAGPRDQARQKKHQASGQFDDRIRGEIGVPQKPAATPQGQPAEEGDIVEGGQLPLTVGAVGGGAVTTEHPPGTR